jgi:hypothetical protein
LFFLLKGKAGASVKKLSLLGLLGGALLASSLGCSEAPAPASVPNPAPVVTSNPTVKPVPPGKAPKPMHPKDIN